MLWLRRPDCGANGTTAPKVFSAAVASGSSESLALEIITANWEKISRNRWAGYKTYIKKVFYISFYHHDIFQLPKTTAFY